MIMDRQIHIDCADLVRAYEIGQSTIDLARRYHCSPTTIAIRLRTCGAVLRPSRFQPARVPETELRRLYLDERLPLIRIAEHFHVSVSTIGNKRRIYGI